MLTASYDLDEQQTFSDEIMPIEVAPYVTARTTHV
jgi:hypothetical protein